MRTALLLVEDSALFRAALTNTLTRNRAIRVVACSSSSLLERNDLSSYDVVILDSITWAAGPDSLVQAAEAISKYAPVLLLGREEVVDSQLEALRKGAVGFVKQTASIKVLQKAIHAVSKGKIWLERDLFRKVTLTSAKNPGRGRLRDRDEKILYLVAAGKTNKEIGAVLGFTERTIKAHVSDLFRTVGVPNRAGLAAYAIARGLAILGRFEAT